MFHDRIRSLLLGRPSHLPNNNHSTPMPTVEDARWVQDDASGPIELDASHKASLETFVANCKLVPIVDKYAWLLHTLIRRIIEGFMTVQAARQPLSHIAKITLLDSVLEDIASLEQDLPKAIRRKAYNDERILYPTGVSECTLRQVLS